MAQTVTPLKADNLYQVTLTIASGESVSGVLSTGGAVPVAILLPGTWTAASLCWQGCLTADGTFRNVVDVTGNRLDVTVVANSLVTLVGNDAPFLPFLKLLSHNAGTPENQAGARTIQVVMRKYLS